jgi:Uncharacterized protein conserved in bacteria (DUF2332)
MADWTGNGVKVADRYREMADYGYGYRDASPSYERICRAIADDPVLLDRILELPVPKQQPNLLMAATRFLGGPSASYAEFRAWTLANWDAVAATALARRTQTNEPRRCAGLLPAFPAGPLALLEVGASAGLCLLPDRYAYEYTGAAGLARVGASDVVLPCEVAGPVPIPAALPTVTWRAGLDLHPLDVASAEDVRWLESLIWPEQTDRLERLRAAVAAARIDPPRIVTGDLLVDLPALVTEAPDDVTLVVYHSAVLAYVDADGRAQFEATIASLQRERDIVWVANEAPGVVSGTDLPFDGEANFVLSRNGVPLGWTGQHGHSVEWLASA